MKLHITITGRTHPNEHLYRIVAVSQNLNTAKKYHSLIMETEEHKGYPMAKSIVGKHQWQNRNKFVDIITRELLES